MSVLTEILTKLNNFIRQLVLPTVFKDLNKKITKINFCFSIDILQFDSVSCIH